MGVHLRILVGARSGAINWVKSRSGRAKSAHVRACAFRIITPLKVTDLGSLNTATVHMYHGGAIYMNDPATERVPGKNS